jgi:hypothetical protein
MKVRDIDLATDLPTLQRWWAGHKANPMPPEFLPSGFMGVSGGIEIAAAFLYLDAGGKLGVITNLTTAPNIAFSRYLVEDVRKLMAHIERVAKDQGCTAILSMAADASGHARLMPQLGWTTAEGPAHVMFCKKLEGA